jgi:hypothetical protein
MGALLRDLDHRLPEERRGALRRWEQRLHASIARSFRDDERKLAASVADRQGLGVSPRQISKM